MQCGIAPEVSFTSYCSFVYRRSLFPWFLRESIQVPINTTQVRHKLGYIHHLFLTPFAPVITFQALDMSTCVISFNNITPPQSAHLYDGILRLVLSAILLILAVAQTLRQSILLYKATKQWHLNQYMQRLTSDGIIYFIVYAFFSLFSVSICYHRIIHLELPGA